MAEIGKNHCSMNGDKLVSEKKTVIVVGHVTSCFAFALTETSCLAPKEWMTQ
jgi:hypothetical protein